MTDAPYTEYSKLKGTSLKYWRDKAEGLASDLDFAIEVMAQRAWGNRDTASMATWLSLNYGRHEAVVKARAHLKQDNQ